MRTVPAAAKLNKRNARKNIGLTVLNVDRSVYEPFTRESVVEERPGFYVAEGGVSAPPAGGYIVWGLKTRSIVEASIEPMPADPTVTIAAMMTDALAEADRRSSVSLNRVFSLIESIDINTPIRESQNSILSSVKQYAEQTSLLADSLTEQIDNRLKLNEDNLILLESIVSRMENSQGEELAIGNQISDILRYVGEVKESVLNNLQQLNSLEESIRNNADVDAMIEQQKAIITEFFDLMGAE